MSLFLKIAVTLASRQSSRIDLSSSDLLQMKVSNGVMATVVVEYFQNYSIVLMHDITHSLSSVQCKYSNKGPACYSNIILDDVLIY